MAEIWRRWSACLAEPVEAISIGVACADRDRSSRACVGQGSDRICRWPIGAEGADRVDRNKPALIGKCRFTGRGLVGKAGGLAEDRSGGMARIRAGQDG